MFKSPLKTQLADTPRILHPRRSTSSSFDDGSGNVVRPFQSNKFIFVLQRLDGWKSLLKHLCENLKHMAHADRSRAGTYEKISKGWAELDRKRVLAFQEGSGVNSLVESLRHSQTLIAATQACMADLYETRIIPSLHCLLQDIKQWHTDITMENLHREKQANRDLEMIQAAKKTVNSSATVWAEKLKDEGDQSNQGGFLLSIGKVEDPWFLYLGFKAAVKIAQDNISGRNQSSMEEIKAFSAFEEALIKNLKTILTSLSTSTKDSSPMMEVRSKLFADFFQAVNALNAANEWKMYSTYHAHLTQSSNEAMESPALTDAFTDVPLVKAVKEGHCLISDRCQPTGWKDVYFVLTPVGFLYQFESAPSPESTGLVPKPVDRWVMRQYYVLPMDSSKKEEVQLKEVKDSIFKRSSKKLTLKFSSAKEADSWYTEFKRFVREQASKTKPEPPTKENTSESNSAEGASSFSGLARRLSRKSKGKGKEVAFEE